MKALISAALIFSGLAMSGCVTVPQKPKGELYPAMYQEMPKTILVLPAVNHSTAADAPHLYSSTIAQPLSNAGFYVLSTEVTQKFLENEGLTTGEQLTSVPAQKFSDTFGADAVLYVTINKWETSYFVLGGHVTVGISYILKSTKTGSDLWAYSNEMKINTGGDSNNGGGLLGALIATAIKTAQQDYVPIARRVNFMALNRMPFGGYHKLHGKDNKIMLTAQQKEMVSVNQ